jgi:hypothetical protein
MIIRKKEDNMLNLKFYFVIMLVLFSVFCFSDQIDPAMGNKTGYHSSQVSLESAYIRAYSSRDTIPPSFTITHIENGDVTIQVTSDEDIFTGWVDEKLVWSAINFDYWWLNTRLAKDMQNNIFAGIKLYEYSTPNSISLPMQVAVMYSSPRSMQICTISLMHILTTVEIPGQLQLLYAIMLPNN